MTDPRHLDPKTAQMRALPKVPRHYSPTGQMRAVQPWEQPGGLVDRPAFVEHPGTDEQPFWQPRPAPDETWSEPRIESVGWWKRFVRWLKGDEVWKR